MTSIIIPAYNAESTIGRCLDSILNNVAQDRIGQIIIIDDGSTDQTSQICKIYSNRSKKINYFRQNNKGVSAARQNGISRVTEEWVVFVDADDEIIGDFTEDISIHKDADWIIFSQIFNKIDAKPSREEMTLAMLNKASLELNKTHLNTVWSKAYRREIIHKNSLHFSSDIYHGEDMLFNLNYIMHCENIVCIGKSIYRLYITQGSATHKFQNGAIKNELAFNKELSELNLGGIIEDYDEIQQQIALDGLFICIGQYISHPDFNGGMTERIKAMKELCSISPYKDAIKKASQITTPKKQFILAVLLNKKLYWLVNLIFRLRRLNIHAVSHCYSDI
ncbi:MAG: glycosyltransferase [Oscillospiraceae bacterium]|nr:glycosyltransferase [Oscillospiraceae bacterium]